MTEFASPTGMTPEEERAFHIRHGVQTGLIGVAYQGRRFLGARRVAWNFDLTTPEAFASHRAALLRSEFEETEFAGAAYRPVRWLDLAVKDSLATAEIADTYLRHKAGIATVRHKREHFDEYIPLANNAGGLKMTEVDGGLSDPTGTISTGDRVLLGNLVDVAEIMAAAQATHAALAASNFWPDWQRLPFDFMDQGHLGNGSL